MLDFTIDSDVLLQPMLLVSGAVERKQTLPVLSNILFTLKEGCLTLDATDTEIEGIAHLTPGEVREEGAVTIPAKKLIDICRTIPDKTPLNFSYKNQKVVLTTGKSRFVLSTLPAEDFPSLDDEVKSIEFHLPTASLLLLLQSTFFSMAQQDVRYYLNGLLFALENEKITAVATDGHRLSLCSIEATESLPDYQCILPRKGVSELIRLLADIEDERVLVSATKNHFYLDTKQFTLITKLIDGKFPSYQRALPVNNDKEIFVNRSELRQALMRVSILANDKVKGVLLSLDEGRFTVSANNQDKEEAVEEVNAKTKVQTAFSIGLNATYLLDALNHIDDETVRLSFSSPSSSMLVQSAENSQAQYIIMPMRI